MAIASAAYIFGTVLQPSPTPAFLRGSVVYFGINFAVYRLFLVAVGLAVTLVLVLTLEFTRFGQQVRAAVDNQRMARGLGINVDGTFALAFALGSGLAGLGGALAIEIVGLDPSFALIYLVYVLIVVSVGGLGSIWGSFVAAVLIGVSDIAGKYYVPRLGAFLIYLVMILLLMWRPNGPVRKAIAMTEPGLPPDPYRYLRAPDPLASAGIPVLARDHPAVLPVPELSLAREPDRDHRFVRAVARSDPGLRRHRLARPRRLLRHRRLYRRHHHRSTAMAIPSSACSSRRCLAGIFGYATSFIISRFKHLALIMITLGIGFLVLEARQQRALADRRRRWPAGHPHRQAARHVRFRSVGPHGLRLFAGRCCS